jgi:hypothetical protein
MGAVDLQEYRNLKDTALALEKLLSNSPNGVNPVLQTTLLNIHLRLEVLEREIKQDEIKIRVAQEAAILVTITRWRCFLMSSKSPLRRA